jgi:hypothetical protein
MTPRSTHSTFANRAIAALFVIGTALFGTLVPVASALASNDDECQDTIDTYNRRMRDLDSSIRRYFPCVQSSRGRDDCSSEYSRVRSEQDDFERAVRDYTSECL